MERLPRVRHLQSCCFIIGQPLMPIYSIEEDYSASLQVTDLQLFFLSFHNTIVLLCNVI